MRRWLVLLSLLTLLPAPARANGFGWFRRHREPATVTYYYAPAPLYVVPLYEVVPARPVVVLPPTPTVPRTPLMPLAPVETAPPSTDPFLPTGQGPNVGEVRSTSLKPSVTVFDLYPSAGVD